MSEMDQEKGAQTANHFKSELWEWVKALLVALGLVLVIRWFLFAPFIVEGPSMEPNFHTGERLIVNKIIYSIRAAEHGEVVVFHATKEKDYIKRVIALPGETVKVDEDKVYVNGQLIEEPYLKEAVDEAEKKGVSYNVRNYAEHTVPEGTIFVMGDNRSNSYDSRDIGFIQYDQIVGRADIVFWPINDLQLVH
jgi:signal peptidase I